MKKCLLLCFFLFPLCTVAQKFISEKSTVVFFSSAPVEDITAQNDKSVSLFNSGTGEIAFSIPVREFIFAKSLMQTHFNEKYLESEKFPKSTFQGKVIGYTPGSNGVQSASAQGKLSIHGVTRDVNIPGTIEEQDNRLAIKAKFKVRLEDFAVTIPKLLWQNISEEVEVTIEFTYKPYEK